ncbi:MAG: glycosyltransferase [Pseudomonadota bacterium]
MSTAICSAPAKALSRSTHRLISVLVPHFNQMALLRLCLESLLSQRDVPAPIEIIVADNESPGGIQEVIDAFPTVIFLSVAERGAACARNAAMKVAKGDVFAFIDADCVADPAWIANGVTALAEKDLIGGAVSVTAKNPRAMTPVESFEAVFAFHQKAYVEKKGFSVTANLFVRAETAKMIGWFTNGLSEDREWCTRARALGFCLAFSPTAKVCHPARRDFEELVQKWDRLVRERWNGLGSMGLKRRATWLALTLATALSAGPHLARIALYQGGMSIRQRMEAALVLVRIRFWRAGRMMAFLTAREDCTPAV